MYSKLPNLVIGFHSCEREVFDLGHCLNLTDSFHIDLLENEYELLAADAGYPIP